MPVPANATLKDVTFHSVALGRDVTYRIISPKTYKTGDRLRVIYLLHGNGGSFREWSESSGIAELARDVVLVMPEGHSSYFLNSATSSKDRYEDFLTRDLTGEVECSLPARVERRDRAIAGNSMGGFAAIVVGMKHPELYGFIGALSPPVDATERSFTFRRLSQSLSFSAIFGSRGSATRSAADPFMLVQTAIPTREPYLYLGAGKAEPLLEPIQRFDRALTRHGVTHEFSVRRGGHDWGQWREQLPGLVGAFEAR